jgi:DHA1 family multidrug resistance protein-like MFS transporter
MVIPIFPFYIDHFGATGRDLGILMAIFAVMQFLFSPFWGRQSDRFGRKPILMIGVVGNAISLLIFALAPNLTVLFLARALSGVLSSATMPTAMAFVSDSTTQENRSGGMGMMGAAMGMGMVIGPGIGGWFAEISLAMPFFVASGLSVVTLMLIWAILPESLAPEDRQRHESHNVLDQFKEMWQALFGPIGFLLFLAFLVSFGLTAFEGIFGLYTLHRYNFGPRDVGTVLTMMGLISALAQGLLTGRLSKKFGESMLIRASLLGSAIAFVAMISANSTIMVYLSVAFFVTSNAMLRPTVSSLTSLRAEGGQGVAMGLNSSFMSLGRIVGPIWAGSLLDVNLNYPYMSGAVVMLVGFVLTLFFLGDVKPKGTEMAPSEISSD